MKVLKTENGKVALYQRNGSLIRHIGTDDSKSASMRFNDYMILVTTTTGCVKMYTEKGNYVNSLKADGANSAAFIDNNILIFTQEGRIELWNDSGDFLKYL